MSPVLLDASQGSPTLLRPGRLGIVPLSVKELPPSLYLTDKPAFVGDLPWPWVTPEADGERVATLPAQARFEAMPAH